MEEAEALAVAEAAAAPEVEAAAAPPAPAAVPRTMVLLLDPRRRIAGPAMTEASETDGPVVRTTSVEKNEESEKVCRAFRERKRTGLSNGDVGSGDHARSVVVDRESSSESGGESTVDGSGEGNSGSV